MRTAALALLTLAGCAHPGQPSTFADDVPRLSVGAAFIAGGASARLALVWPREGATWKDCVAATAAADVLPDVGVLLLQRAAAPRSFAVDLRSCVATYGVPPVEVLADGEARTQLAAVLVGALDAAALPAAALLPPCEAAYVAATKATLEGLAPKLVDALADPAHVATATWPGVDPAACR